MNDNVAAATKQTNMKVAVSKKSQANYVQGRREFFTYRDLGVTDGTSGRMRAQVTTAKEGMTRPTGWHYHVCEMQFVYVLRGWVDLEFEDMGVVRLESGDSVMIPGGARHQEIATDETFQIVEVSVPAEMGTVDCAAPANAKFK